MKKANGQPQKFTKEIKSETNPQAENLNFDSVLENFFMSILKDVNVEELIEESSEHDEVVSDILAEAFKDYFYNIPDEIKFKMFEYIFSDREKFDELFNEIWNNAFDYAIEYYYDNNYRENYGDPSKRSILLLVQKIGEDPEEFRTNFWSFSATDPEYLEKIKQFFKKKENEKNIEQYLKERKKAGNLDKELKKVLPEKFHKHF